LTSISLTQASTPLLLQPAPGLGQRTDGFIYELLDRDLAVLGQVHPTWESSPTISANNERATVRTLDGFEVVDDELEHIDLLADRVRPVALLENGARFPLGVYVFGERKCEVYGLHEFEHTFLMDQGWVLDQPLERPVGLVAGGSCQSLFFDLAYEVGITHIHFDPQATVVSEPVAWAAGSSRYKAMSDLATKMGCLPPFFDNMGTLHCHRAPGAESTVQFTYGPGNIVADTTLETDDSYQAPNRYIAIGDSSTTPISGFYDIPDSAPHSIARRGYVVAEVVDVPGIQDAYAAAEAARVAAVKDTRSYVRVGFTSPLDPRHDVNAIVDYGDGVWLEVEQRLVLQAGGNHEHILTRLW
jgi:hypothetical protein